LEFRNLCAGFKLLKQQIGTLVYWILEPLIQTGRERFEGWMWKGFICFFIQ